MGIYLYVVFSLFAIQNFTKGFQEDLLPIIADVIHQMDYSGYGVHDIGIARIHRSVLKDTELQLLPFADVTYQLLPDDELRVSTTEKKLSLLLLDMECFVNSTELFQLMDNLSKTGLWSYSTAVVMFSRTLTPVNITRRFGAVNLLLVLITESGPETSILNFLTNSLNAVPIDSAAHLLFSSKVLKVNGYQFNIHMDTSSKPFHIFHSTVSAGGIDVELTEIVISHLNGTVRYSIDNEVFIRWIFHSRLEPLGNPPIFDLTFFHMPRFSNVLFEHLLLPFHEEICITVPKQRRRILFLQLARPFSVPVWLLVGFFLVFRMKLNLPALFSSPKSVFIKGCVQTSFLVLEFVLIEAYLSKVIANLATMRYEPDPTTLETLNDRQQHFALNAEHVPFLEAYPKLKLTLSIQERDFFIRTHAFMVSCKMAEYWGNSKENFDPVSNDRLRIILKERIRSMVRTFAFGSFSPFIERFSECFGRLMYTGIWNKV